MMNDCVEAFFNDVLELPFSELHKEGGVPTAEISTRFPAPSRIGDDLKIKLSVTHLGRTSCGLRIHAECGSESRFEANSTLVLVNKAGRPRAWPKLSGTKSIHTWRIAAMKHKIIQPGDWKPARGYANGCRHLTERSLSAVKSAGMLIRCFVHMIL